MSLGSLKISSGVRNKGPMSSLQEAPQPSTHRHKGSFLRLPKPALLGLRLDSDFVFALTRGPRATEQTVLQESNAMAGGI